ncbi:unnamed protein product [Cyprideis torosa]|uniref:[histone H4]-lysine(20) N-methyltransferase n=1 Tax=Cyprideis torosa TaxID=163714 RepID=A0A7R8ZTD4_9CRUS|nr:unnamed protein product [Cyprideis torosa]CAG0897954.1 unnamed protein product [Cyprideis torosa]
MPAAKRKVSASTSQKSVGKPGASARATRAQKRRELKDEQECSTSAQNGFCSRDRESRTPSPASVVSVQDGEPSPKEKKQEVPDPCNGSDFSSNIVESHVGSPGKPLSNKSRALLRCFRGTASADKSRRKILSNESNSPATASPCDSHLITEYFEKSSPISSLGVGNGPNLEKVSNRVDDFLVPGSVNGNHCPSSAACDSELYRSSSDESESEGKENRLISNGCVEDTHPDLCHSIPHRIQSPVALGNVSQPNSSSAPPSTPPTSRAPPSPPPAPLPASPSSLDLKPQPPLPTLSVKPVPACFSPSSAFSKLKLAFTPQPPQKERRPKEKKGKEKRAPPCPPAAPSSRPLTSYFPSVRRSSRKPASKLQQEQLKEWEQRIASDVEEGLEVRCFPNKGRGVVALRRFQKGEFVVEYAGELVDMKEAQVREVRYAKDRNKGCYMYYFEDKNVQWCVDATKETSRFGRLINHSRTRPNIVTKTITLDGLPRLVFFATQDIQVGEELLYDYGDRSKRSMEAHPWLAY